MKGFFHARSLVRFVKITILCRPGDPIAERLENELELRGHSAASLDPVEVPFDKRLLKSDLLVLAGPPDLPGVYAGLFARANGVRVVPDPELLFRLGDAVERQELVRACKLKAPKALFGFPDVLQEYLEKRRWLFPFIVKADSGPRHLHGTVVRTPKDLKRLPPAEPVYVEQFVHGRSFEVYFVGEFVRMFKKPRLVLHEPLEVRSRRTRELREVNVPVQVHRVVSDWRAFAGLQLGKLDLVLGDVDGKYYVVGAQAFPEFRGWPGAEKLVAQALLKEVRLARYKRLREAYSYIFYMHEKCAVNEPRVRVDHGADGDFIAADQEFLFYAVHPVRVCGILMSAGFDPQHDEDLLIAALLHDVVEETTATIEDVRARFGSAVADLVEEVTKPEEVEGKMDWLRSFQFASREAKVLKMADRLDKLLDKDSTAWPFEEKKRYAENAKLIYHLCRDAHPGLAAALKKAVVAILGPGGLDF
ncbi:MAG: hypothetical protein Kow0069_37070 [Promethearchaeota archaeon]